MNHLRHTLSAVTLTAVILAATVFASTRADARDYSKVSIKALRLADGIHMLAGAGGNIGLSTGADGVFMIDDQFAPLTAKILSAVKQITTRPVKFVLNTHWHSDHTGGNENLAKQGTVIVAHDNVRKLMSVDQMQRAFKRKVPAAPAIALPTITFNDSTSFHMNGQTLKIRHLPGAHTNGDSFVHFVEADVIHTGDVFFNGFYPFIDVQHGGSITGVINAANVILKTGGADTKIIPGHGPLADKAALRDYRDMLIGVRKAVQALVNAGKSRAEAAAANPTAAFDEKWGKGFMRPMTFTGFVYDSLKK